MAELDPSKAEDTDKGMTNRSKGQRNTPEPMKREASEIQNESIHSQDYLRQQRGQSPKNDNFHVEGPAPSKDEDNDNRLVRLRGQKKITPNTPGDIQRGNVLRFHGPQAQAESPKYDTISVEGSVGHKMFIYVALAILLVALAAFVSYHLLEKPTTDKKLNYPQIFQNRTKEIQKLFPNQTKRFWSILKSHSLVHLRNKNPDQPLVILLGAPPSAHAVVNCLAKKLAWCLDPNVSPSNFIDGAKYSKDDGHNTKKILDDKLTDIFESGARAALVMHLEQLPPPSPLLFYKYCDNDQAPYKHAGIIFTVYLRHEISASLSPVEAEGSIEKFLSNDAWGQSPYDRDSVLALLSRIADNVALVSHESDEVVQSVCHDVQ